MNARHLRSARLLLSLFLALSVLTLLPTFARANLIDDSKQAVGALIGSTADAGGFIIGGFLVLIVMMALWAITRDAQMGLAGGMAVAVIVWGIGYWPLWGTVLLVAVLAILFVWGRAPSQGA